MRYLCWFAAPTVYMVGLAYACILAVIWSCVSYQYVLTNHEYLMFYICSNCFHLILCVRSRPIGPAVLCSFAIHGIYPLPIVIPMLLHEVSLLVPFIRTCVAIFHFYRGGFFWHDNVINMVRAVGYSSLTAWIVV